MLFAVFGVGGNHFLDGATLANNPAMVAATEAIATLQHLARAPGSKSRDYLGDLTLLSLGGVSDEPAIVVSIGSDLRGHAFPARGAELA